MKTVSLFVIATWTMLAAQGGLAHAQVAETPRTMEHPAVTAERDAQLVTPAAKSPSWGPSLYPAPAEEPEAAKAKRPARADPAAPPAHPDRASQQAPRQVRTPRRAVDQVLTPTPRIVGSTPAGTPVLSDGPAHAAAPAPAAVPPRGSVPATCSGNGCYDASGQRLGTGAGTGVGSPAVTPQGQLCTRGVVGVQCF